MLYRALPPFDYEEPTSIAEAAGILAEAGTNTAVLAGGLSLLDDMKRGLRSPGLVVSLQRIPSLSEIAADGNGELRIGPMVTIRQAERSPAIAGSYGVLHQALKVIHSVQVKNMGTLVGNVCVGTPASDILTALVALDGSLELHGNGSARILVAELCEGAKKTRLGHTDLVGAIVVPATAPSTYSAYANLMRTSSDISKLSVAARITMDGGTCRDVRIAAGAVAPTVVRLTNAERLLEGQPLSDRFIEAAAREAESDPHVTPIDDIRSTAEYRRHTVRVLAKRALQVIAAERRIQG